MATGSGAQTLDSQSPLFLSSIRKRSRSRLDPSILPIMLKKKKEKEDDILDLTVAFHQSIQA
jgi:hypothetical protein